MAEAVWLGRQWLEVFRQAFGGRPLEAAPRGTVPVKDLEVRAGCIFGRVPGHRGEHPVQIWIDPVPARSWKSGLADLRRILTEFADEAGPELVGPMFEQVLKSTGIPLFPRRLSGVCMCTEDQSPCSHMAALGAAFAAELSRRPSLLLRFVGADANDAAFLDEVLAATDADRQPAFDDTPWTPSRRPAISAQAFWGTGRSPASQPAAAGAAEARTSEAATADAARATPSARRDLPLRIRTPNFWASGPDVSQPLAALCQTIAGWSPPPAPDTDAITVGFTPEELEALRPSIRPPASGTHGEKPELRRPERSAGPKGHQGKSGNVTPLLKRKTRRACTHCGAQVQADWRFCHACGQPVRPADEGRQPRA